MVKVLVLTNSFDTSHIEIVTNYLHNSGNDVIRVDLDSVLAGHQSITWEYQSGRFILADGSKMIDLMMVDSVWFRKPFGFGSTHGFVEKIQDPVQRSLVEQEVRDVVNGFSYVLDSKHWVNHPRDIARARLKPYQLHFAQNLGFAVPDSIITSSPEKARFFCRQGPTVFKALATQILDYQDVVGSIDTTLMTPELVVQLGFIRSQPILLQRCIEKVAELRVTCMGDAIFVARQMLRRNYDVIDWRSLQGAENSVYEPAEIDSKTEERIRLLMKALNLKFAAMDFAVDRDGRLWFLEVNPNGQWLGYTDVIGIPAAARMAKLLAP